MALLLTVGAAAKASSEPTGKDFASIIAEWREKRPRAGQVANLSDVTATNEAFLRRLDFAALEPGEIAILVRLNAFGYGDLAHELARSTLIRIAPQAAKPDVEGALATVLCVKLSVPAGLDGKERQAWRTRALRHPGLTALLQSEFGDLALDAAMSAGGGAEDQERILGLAEKLDASKSTAAAPAVLYYWNRRVDKLPAGERRETIRRQLVDFLTVAVEKEKAHPDGAETGKRLEEDLTLLSGLAARGELLGRAAPEIHFLWSSRDDLKSLSDLRGKVVLVDLWATWCHACVEAFPEVAKLKEHYRGFDVEVVGVTSLQGNIVGLRGGKAIDCRGDAEKELRLLREYIQERAVTWPIAVGRENVINPDYGVEGLPTVVIIAPDGTVRFKSPGFSQPEAIARIDALLTEFKRAVPGKTPVPESPPVPTS